MKVNMTPNPLDVVTIHASQGDTEARQWEFELHNNGELIDTSDVKEQLVFKAYKGGTEQILPENGAVPVTAPFVGDIKYPDATRTDQEFLYRESPTEEDGLAKITDVKGNTLVWNQLVQKINSQTGAGVTITQNSDGSITVNGTATNNIYIQLNNDYRTIIGNKYYCSLNNANVPEGFSLYNDGGGLSASNSPIVAEATQQKRIYIRIATGTTINNLTVYPQCIDLTAIFGSGNEPATVEEFTSLFSLPYYDYNQGSLLSFNGNGIKTVGFNQWDEEWEAGSINAQGQNSTGSTIRSKNYISVFPNTSYFARTGDDDVGAFIYFYDADKNFLSKRSAINGVFSTPNECRYIRFRMYDPQYGTVYKGNICINISDLSKNGTYEPYTSSTLSLPISTYFPTGMKSAGNVYDELTESKAITRVGMVDLGSLSWFKEEGTYITGGYCFTASSDSPFLPQVKKPSSNSDVGNILCGKYQNLSQFVLLRDGIDKTICLGTGTLRTIDKSYTDATSFKTAMNGVYLYYELATPTETPITTASLVTENAEIPLSNEDGVLIGKCTEELSAEPGFIDAKIKLSDGDGECYSNKIQLHVERSPQ